MFQEAANNPIEDRWLVAHLPYIGQDTLLLAVLDGHGGQECANFAQNKLIQKIGEQFLNAVDIPISEIQDNFKNALEQAYRQIELEQIHKVKDSFQLGFESVAKVGTCITSCILSKLDDKVHLTIANMGDCEIALFTSHPIRESLSENYDGNCTLGIQNKINDNDHQYSNQQDHVGIQRSNYNYLKGTRLTEVHNAHNPNEQELL